MSTALLALTLELWKWSLERDRHHDISPACTRQVEHNRRQGVEGIPQHQRVENRPSDNLSLSQGVRDRLVCFSPHRPTPQICELETGPRGITHGCSNNGLGPFEGVYLSPLQPNTSCTEQGGSGQSRHHTCRTSLASPAMVASPAQSSGRATSTHPEHQTPPEGPGSPPEDTSNVPENTLSRVSHLRGQYQAMGFSNDIAEILLSAACPSKQRTYKSAWGHWSRWCNKQNIDPFSAPLDDILLFLTEYFNSGPAYRSVNVVRSAIFTTHTKIDGLPVGQHPLVVQLLKGMLNNRPPKPRYTHTSDVATVTKYILSLGKNRSLPLKQLSLKLAMLLSLSCSERVSSLTKMDLRHCRRFGVYALGPS